MKPLRFQRGVALVIVLTLLLLISAAILAFFGSVQTESRSSSEYKGTVTVKQLVSTANALVTGQLSDATRSSKEGVAKVTGSRLAWASQPGMIRTWDDTGKGWKIFKLYSSNKMVTDWDPDGRYSVTEKLKEEVPNTWPAQPALFTDLNEPIVVPDEYGLVERPKLFPGVKFRAAYPILDPVAMAGVDIGGGLAIRGVEGFSIEPPPGFRPGSLSLSVGFDPYKDVPANYTGNPAAMPVRWIYVLRDGTLTVPTGFNEETKAATWEQVGDQKLTPSKANPIVGRIAFWTDDETCKLNINTASEPTPWDTPRGVSKNDLAYGKYQPAKNEYQRYPGHPATTSLTPVFFPGLMLTTLGRDYLYDMVPRIQSGGTRAGSVVATSPILPDEDRLYATVDEMLFQKPELLPGGKRTENDLMDYRRLSRSRFFLTANSRAPELNLYGQPRVSLWPVSSSRTAFDKLASFCSTIGGSSTPGGQKPFYFQRQNAGSATADYEGIKRNQELYAYLRRLLDQPVPGFGGTFAAKWGVDRDQILTQIFDYIRCVNLKDTQAGATPYAANGQVTPIRINSPGGTVTKGFGRFHSIQQFGFHFICSQKGQVGAETVAANKPTDPEERLIEASFLFEPFSPSLGWYQLLENMVYEVSFKTPFTINGVDLKMQSGTATLNNRIGSGWHNNGRQRGGTGGIRGPIQAFGGGNYTFVSKANPRVRVGGQGATSMAFSGGTVEVKVYANSAGGTPVQTFTLSFPPGNFPLPDLVQEGTTPYRGAAATSRESWWTFTGRYNGGNVDDAPQAPGPEYADPARRWINSGGDPGFKAGSVFRREDVVRSLVPVHGDMRLIAAMPVVTADQFVPVDENLWSSQYRFLHLFANASGPHFHYGFANEPGVRSTNPLDIPPSKADDQLVPFGDVVYHYANLPQIRPGAGKIFNKWGDFDNGMAQWPDGAFINKPDEGNQSSSSGDTAYFSWNFTEPTEVNFSPNRLVPSAGMLGSLPTGVKRHSNSQPNAFHAWETLLFRPQAGHPGQTGANQPKDHLIMDLFWMPVCEPYAISEPFSTAGKVNLNYEIAPFRYLRRATALHGVMRSEEPLMVPNEVSKYWKIWDHESNDHGIPVTSSTDPEVRANWPKLVAGTGAPFNRLRVPIDVDGPPTPPGILNIQGTLRQAEDRFQIKGDLFRSATEICDLHLVRTGERIGEYLNGSIWEKNRRTGDNTRERPYTNLYARLTTRSNTFNIHARVQVLQGTGQTDADWKVWKEDRAKILAEHRGSTIVERYIDPADPNLVDFANAEFKDSVADIAYRTRVISSRRFVP